jgi:UDP-N-acetylglucosamine 2-epimerase (non-hydrolysing)
MVVVTGDVNPTMACAIVGAKSGSLVAHVEAGLRSRDWSMPEEVNRVVTDRVSDLLLAPSEDAVKNLQAEGHDGRRIVLVGNVMIDTLLRNRSRALARPILDDLGLRSRRFALATLHRPANVDDPEMLALLMRTLEEIAEVLPVVFPVHPRTAARLENSSLVNSVMMTPPLGYLDFLGLEAQASVVLTDSGGVQEETTVLGVPCLTLRDNTERPITINQGTNQLVGRDQQRIVAAVHHVLEHGVIKRFPELWDGCAGERTADAIMSVLSNPGVHPRPTSE